MSHRTSLTLNGPEGALEARCTDDENRGFGAVIAHPHPLYGGTMDNAVVQAVAEQVEALDGWALTFNFRGTGSSHGRFDGSAEKHDLEAAELVARERLGERPLLRCGYSFGAAMSASLLHEEASPTPTLLLAPPITHYDFSWLAEHDGPVALIFGSLDDLTPQDPRQRLIATTRNLVSHHELDGAGHDLGSFSQPEALAAAVRSSLEALRP